MYEGELENDNKHGKGTMKEPDGHKYEGEVQTQGRQGKRQGNSLGVSLRMAECPHVARGIRKQQVVRQGHIQGAGWQRVHGGMNVQ